MAREGGVLIHGLLSHALSSDVNIQPSSQTPSQHEDRPATRRTTGAASRVNNAAGGPLLGMRLIDLSHVIEHGMTTLTGVACSDN